LTVDFVVRQEPAHRVATKTLKGKWPGDRAVGREYDVLHGWVRARGLRIGKWFFRSLSETETAGKWEVGIEVRGGKNPRGGEGVSIREFPATTVVAVKFNPSLVSPMVAYSSLEGWMKWAGRPKKYKWNGPWREVYSANPWKSKSAWANTEIQAPLKK